MFALYRYAAGSTFSNVVADIIKIITGETNKATLSAACVQADTYILTTYCTSNITVHDAAAGTNIQILKQPNADGSTFKYIGIDYSTADTIRFGGCETWDAVAHIGTNALGHDIIACTAVQACNVLSVSSIYINPSNGGYAMISIDPNGFHFNIKAAANWSYSDGVTVSYIEHTRTHPNLALARGYPCWAMRNIDFYYVPRMKHIADAGDSSFYYLNMLGMTNNSATAVQGLCRDSITELPVRSAIPLSMFYLAVVDIANYRGVLHDFYGTMVTTNYFTTATGVAVLDETTINGVSYIAFSTHGADVDGNNHILLVRKG